MQFDFTIGAEDHEAELLPDNDYKRRVLLFKQCAEMKSQERAEMIDTGCFNSYIEAYTLLALDAMGKAPEELKEARAQVKACLEETRAADAVKLADELPRQS